jgi:hypothetical protein
VEQWLERLSVGEEEAGQLVPRTLEELYDTRYGVMRAPKWGVQLLERPTHKRSSAKDVADMVMALEEGPLGDMLAFSTGDATVCVMPKESGVWGEVNGKEHHQIYHALATVADRVDGMVIRQVQELVRRLRLHASGATGADAEHVNAELAKAEEHLRDVMLLYERLGTPTFASGVVKRIITERVRATEEGGLKLDVLDAAKGCVAFNDGVYRFGAASPVTLPAQPYGGRLHRGVAARAFYLTQTVGYAFEELVECASGGASGATADADDAAVLPSAATVKATAGWGEYDAFMTRIFSSTPEVRAYLIDLLASSLLNENRQVMVIHHSLRGANGKSTLFALIRKAFGSLFIKCASALLNPSNGSASGPNEELVSTKGKRLVNGFGGTKCIWATPNPGTGVPLGAARLGHRVRSRGLSPGLEMFALSARDPTRAPPSEARGAHPLSGFGAHILCPRIQVLFSEPSSKVKLSAAFIKELTGGDEQSTRANYGKKQTFVFNGMVHVLCNKIPELDDMDGGVQRRLRCIPYGSSFVDDPMLVDPSAHVHAIEDVQPKFDEWKHFMMWEIMTAADARAAGGAGSARKSVRDEPPPVVMASTKHLIERENTVGAFIKERLRRTDDPKDRVTFKEAYLDYAGWCKDEKVQPVIKKYFGADMKTELGGWTDASNGLTNFWRGWSFVSVSGDADSTAEL